MSNPKVGEKTVKQKVDRREAKQGKVVLHTVPGSRKVARNASKGKMIPKPATARPATSGFKYKGDILVPQNMIEVPVPTSAIKKGFEKAKSEIKEMVDEIVSIMTTSYNIAEIELSISFNADGKFLGFGVGGATSIKIKIIPTAPRE